MTHLLPGANAPLSSPDLVLSVMLPPGAEIDVSALQLTASGKVRGDGDMCFFNQPSISGGALVMTSSTGTAVGFSIKLGQIDAAISKIVLTATIGVSGVTFGALGPVRLVLSTGIEAIIPHEGRTETALILGEIYRHASGWKFRNVGQGFNGGLAALAKSFGVDVDEGSGGQKSPASVPPSLTAKEQRLIDLEKRDPELVSLVKKVAISLEKRGFSAPRSKVCLCIDISGSMQALYRSGKIDTLVQRVLALGLSFDDDGDIDVFLFGNRVHDYGTVDAQTYRGFSQKLMREVPLEGGTRYGAAMERIRNFYRDNNPEGLPVYVLFVTDGGTDDKPKTKKMLIEASGEPIFWKLVGLIEPGFFSGGRAGFLQELDDLPGRQVDNADFFNVSNPADPNDGAFFDSMMNEFPEWMAATRRAGILKP